jgi:hypothetical protein
MPDRTEVSAALPAGAELSAPTPMAKRNEWLAPEPEFRMDAYYYGFDATGILAIDLILSAVACAGKSFHHTDQWGEKVSPYHDRLRGDTPVEWIQNAANDAAAAILASTPSSAGKTGEAGNFEAYWSKIPQEDLCDATFEMLRAWSLSAWQESRKQALEAVRSFLDSHGEGSAVRLLDFLGVTHG